MMNNLQKKEAIVIGKRLRQLLGIEQVQEKDAINFAKIFNISKDDAYLYLIGTKDPDVNLSYKMSKYFDVDHMWFIDESCPFGPNRSNLLEKKQRQNAISKMEELDFEHIQMLIEYEKYLIFHQQNKLKGGN